LFDRQNEQKLYAAEFQKSIVKLIDDFKEANEDGLMVAIFSEAVTQEEF
jgi:hypothetical protein